MFLDGCTIHHLSIDAVVRVFPDRVGLEFAGEGYIELTPDEANELSAVLASAAVRAARTK